MIFLSGLVMLIGVASLLIGCITYGAIGYSASLFGIGLIVISLLMRLVGAASATPKGAAVSERTHRKCPACMEFVLRGASKCKHCGSGIEPLSDPTIDGAADYATVTKVMIWILGMLLIVALIFR